MRKNKQILAQHKQCELSVRRQPHHLSANLQPSSISPSPAPVSSHGTITSDFRFMTLEGEAPGFAQGQSYAEQTTYQPIASQQQLSHQHAMVSHSATSCHTLGHGMTSNTCHTSCTPESNGDSYFLAEVPTLNNLLQTLNPSNRCPQQVSTRVHATSQQQSTHHFDYDGTFTSLASHQSQATLSSSVIADAAQSIYGTHADSSTLAAPGGDMHYAACKNSYTHQQQPVTSRLDINLDDIVSAIANC